MKENHSKKKKVQKKSKGKPQLTPVENATAAYYATLSPDDMEEENRLEAAISLAASQVDFDAEY